MGRQQTCQINYDVMFIHLDIVEAQPSARCDKKTVCVHQPLNLFATYQKLMQERLGCVQ